MKKSGAFRARLTANGWVARIFVVTFTVVSVSILCFALIGRMPQVSKLRRERMDVDRLQDALAILESRDLPTARAKTEELQEKTAKLVFVDESEIEAWIDDLEERFEAPGWRLKARWSLEEEENGEAALAKFPAMLGTTNLLKPIGIRFELAPVGEGSDVSGAVGYQAYVGLTRALLDDAKLKRFSNSEAQSDGVRFRSATLAFHVLEGTL